jgi:hypothetical protein
MKTFFAKLVGLSTAVINFYLPVLKELLASGMASLLPVALEIVKEQALTGKDSQAKRLDAVFALREAAVARGINASESIIRYTIESAVQKLKTQ